VSAGSEFPIVIRIDPTGARQGGSRVKRELIGISNTADRLRNTIRAALAFTGVTLGVRSLIRLADTFTNVRSQTRLLARDQDNLQAIMREVLDIANETGGSFEASINLYNRLSRASGSLGLSQRDVLDITDTLNKALAVTGVSGPSAAAGIRQLSQAFGRGVLRGDELVSVLENIPIVAELIADDLNVPVEQIILLGQQGKISSAILADALLNAGSKVEEQFQRTDRTVGQSLQTLQNRLLFVVGELNDATGSTTNLVGVIDSFSSRLQDVGDVALVVFNRISDAISTAVTFWSSELEFFSTDADNAFNGVEVSLFNVAIRIATAIDALIEKFGKFFVFIARGAAIVTGQGAAAAGIQGIANALEASIGDAPTVDALIRLAEDVDRIQRERAAAIRRGRPGEEGGPRTPTPTEAPDFSVAQVLAQLARQAELLRLGNQEREVQVQLDQILARLAKEKVAVSPGEERQIQAALELNQSLAEQARAYEFAKGPAEEILRIQQALLQNLRDGRITVDEYTRAWEELNIRLLEAEGRTGEAGLLRTVRDLEQRLGSSREVLIDLGTGGVDAFTSALDRASRGGVGFFDAFREGLADLALQFALLQLRLVLLTQLANQFRSQAPGVGGGGGGNLIGDFVTSGFTHAQQGATASPGQPFIVGESGPEPFVPRQPGFIIPNSQGAAVGGKPEVKLAVVNVTDPEELRSSLDSGDLDEAVVNVIGRRSADVAARLGSN